MNSHGIIVPHGAKAQETLVDIYPEEIQFFKQCFVWSSNTKGFYTRQRYETIRDPSGKTRPKWQPFKTRGRWQSLYPELVNSLIEKHLDFERFCRTCEARDRLKPATEETAFWLGTMAGRKTFNDCIDLDSHDLIGWNAAPSRWHSSKTGWMDGPYSDRLLPVIRPSLRFFQIAKVIYDNFPNRIWAFSSANRGLAVWDVYDRSESTHVVHRRIENRLKAAGLTGVEHYPRPAKTPGSLGKCHRRPCGMDSGIIACDGLITDPIEQIRAFMKPPQPPQTPSFQRILEVCWEQLNLMYDLFLSSGARRALGEKKFLVESCEQVIGDIKRWAEQGFPIDWDLVRENEKVAEAPPIPDVVPVVKRHLVVADHDPIEEHATCEYPEYFYSADVEAVAGSAQWVQFVKFLVENGFPAEDKFQEIVSTLALWFGFVELFGEDRSRTKEILRTYVSKQDNSKITRLLTNQQQDVRDHVDRIVDHVLDNEEHEGKQLFAELRQKRENGRYQEVYCFEPHIMGNNTSSYSPTITPLHLICGGLIEFNGTGDWQYQPDLTPLPDAVTNRVRQAFKAKRQLRQNRRTGRYPTLDAITRLFNYLFSGRKSGTRRASQKLLVQMGFPKKNKERRPIFDILEKDRLLHRGGYLSQTRSRQWSLDKSVVEIMHQQSVGEGVSAS